MDQEGFADFKRNRESYRKDKGIKDFDSSELESQINQKHVEDDFVMVNQSNRDAERKNSLNDPSAVRKSHIIRQIEEGQLGVNDADYDQDGNLKLESLQ